MPRTQRPSLRSPGPTRWSRRLAAGAAVVAALALGTTGTQDAAANGDTRTLSILHTHTKESATITFKRDGRYDRAALEQLNWLLRDWRADEPTKMDPRLFDTVWEAYRQVGASEPIHVVSAYRSPGTNAMLRRRSKAVAEFSQHMLGKAMDFYLPDVSIDRIREAGMVMQRGGVGWYPRAGSPFVHLDVGSVRSWPRMSHDQLVRLFPDGRTVHLPAGGPPLPGYEVAKAEILARGGSVAGIATQVAGADEDEGGGLLGLLAGLFGGGQASTAAPAAAPAPAARARAKPAPVVVASADPEDAAGLRAAAPNPVLAYAAPAAPPGPAADARSLLTAERPVPAAPEAVPADALPRALAPLPPRRPAEFAAVAAALAMPLPPPRPAQLAALDVPAAAGGMANIVPAAALVSRALEPAPSSASDPALRGALVAADAEPRAQLRALFAAVPAGAAARPAARAVPVRLAAARPDADAAPAALVVAAPEALALRFGSRSPGDELPARFTGPAARALPAYP